MTDLETKAKDFATRAHKGQTRKYSRHLLDVGRGGTGEPYIVHPWVVAEIVKTVPHTPEMIAAAWLHDTVEDTSATVGDVEKEFGPIVASLVSDLTDISVPEDGNRAKRKAIDRAHTAKASAQAKTIKLADLIHNSSDIVDNDPNFAKIYMKEKVALLEVLTEGEADLYWWCVEIIEEYLE